MENLSGIDLNLMVALDALLWERSVTRAAQRVGLSQPAMSVGVMAVTSTYLPLGTSFSRSRISSLTLAL